MASDTQPINGVTGGSSAKEIRHDHHATVEEETDPDLPNPLTRNVTAASSEDSQSQTAAPAPAKPKAVPLNIHSDESFPLLGSSSSTGKGKASARATSGWGRSPIKTTAASDLGQSKANGSANGPAGHLNNLRTPSGVSSPNRSTPPSSGISTPLPSPWTAARQIVLPGQRAETTERLDIPAGWLIPKEQLKKPIGQTIQDTMKRTKTSIQISTSATKITTFIVRGHPNDVATAKRDIAKELGARSTIAVPFPSSARSLIIGKAGATIQRISKAHNVKIQMPKGDISVNNIGNGGDDMEELTIEGNALGLQGAKADIEAIVGERVITSTAKLTSIPSEFYPFIAGAHNQRIANLEANRGVRMKVPPYERWSTAPARSSGGRPAFQPSDETFIQLSGERSAVQLAKAEVEEYCRSLHDGLSTNRIPINRGQHQFIAGPRGMSHHDFLHETGCAIVFPPDDADPEHLEMITLIGPDDRLNEASDKVLDLASSMHSVTFDASRSFANAPQGAQRHTSNLQRYLKHQGELQRLEENYQSHIHMPEYGPWEVYSRAGRNTHVLRSDLMNIVAGHPPSRMVTVDVDPYYHQQLVLPQRDSLYSQHGVRTILPMDPDEQDPAVLLVFEGTDPEPYILPRKQPSQAEIRQFEAALQAAQQQILDLLVGRPKIITRSVAAPLKHHERVGKLLKREQQGSSPSSIPVRRRPTPAGGAPEDIMLQGADADIEALAIKIAEMIAEEEENERERGYTTSTPFAQANIPQLVGKNGSRINKLREEFDVDITTNKEGLVEIKGPKRRAEACKAHILSLGKQFADEARFVIKVKPQYHRELIGPKGAQINRLQERYDVKIQFPRTSKADTASNDDKSEAGGRGYQPQAPDEVEIRGPKRGAEQARSEVLDLVQYLTDHSHSATVAIPAKFIPRVVGAGGKEIEQIRLLSGAQVDVPKQSSGVGENVKVEISIKGSKKAVDEARRLLEEKSKAFSASATRVLQIDRKHHRSLIGAQGSNLRDIVVKAGGPDDRRELGQIVKFPKPEDADQKSVKVEGEKELVERICNAMEALVLSLENQVTGEVDVKTEYHRVLIGRGGDVRKELESKHGVQVMIPKMGSPGPVKVTGAKPAVEACKAEILALVAARRAETIMLSRKQAEGFKNKGALDKRLKEEFGVTIDFGKPGAAGTAAGRVRQNGGAGLAPVRQVRKEDDRRDMPLITDQKEDVEYGWELYVDVQEESPAAVRKEEEEETVTWTLRAARDGPPKVDSPDPLMAAKAIVEETLSKVPATGTATYGPSAAAVPTGKTQMATGYLMLDPSYYRSIIGKGGQTIEGLKRESGCRITVPKAGMEGEKGIEIRGSEEGVLRCRGLIVDIVRRAGQGRRQY